MTTDTPAITYDIPVPVGMQSAKGIAAKWRDVIRAMGPNGSFDRSGERMDLEQKQVLKAARQLGIRVKTRILDNGTLRVWRVQ